MSCPHCAPRRSKVLPILLGLGIVGLFAVYACASGELPPRASHDPANANAPEAPSIPIPSSMPADTSAAGPSPAHVHGSPEAGPTVYSCVMHPEVLQQSPGTCPKCGMRLRPKTGQ